MAEPAPPKRPAPPKPASPPKPPSQMDPREARLAAALRANLRRRKAAIGEEG
jgi:hypothetical protein